MTQYLTNPPTAVQALANMLDLCAGYALNTYYPTAPEGIRIFLIKNIGVLRTFNREPELILTAC